MGDLIKEVRISDSWYEFGLELIDDRESMNIIRENNKGDVKVALRDTFNLWLDKCEKPTWQKVVDALQQVGKGKLAHTIEEKHCM